MFKIIDKNKLIKNVYTMKIIAPRVSKSIKPGQFVILRIDEKGERIPFPVCDCDKFDENVTIVFKADGESSKQLAGLNVGDYIADFAGPFGQPSVLAKGNVQEFADKNILFVTESEDTARIYPELSWLFDKGILCDVLIGFESREDMMFKKRIESAARNVFISTVDGSLGIKGTTSDVLKSIITVYKKKYDIVVAIGSTEMMRDVSEITKQYNIKTIVSLSTLMLDGTGMCGACRLTIGGEMKFACQDGPEFDGHLVDYEEVMRRQNYYSTFEAKAKFREQNADKHKIDSEAAVTAEEAGK